MEKNTTRNFDIAFQSRTAQETVQVDAVNQLLPYIVAHSPFYHRYLKEHGVAHLRISSLAELEQFPTTNKEMMQQHNMDFLCVPPQQVVEYTATSGTLGKPVTIALTENDLQRLAYNEQQSFATAGITDKDVVQLLLTLDKQFMAGMAYYLGLRNLGAAVIRTGPGVAAMQWDIASRLKSSAWVAVPSFVVKLLDYATQHQLAFQQSSIQKIICIGEQLRNEKFELNPLAQRITSQWNVQLHGTYASTEMQSAFTECSAGKGGHLQPDILIVEILDDDGRQLPAGEVGEVTITTLGIEGMPLLRYRTGDLAAYEDAPCSCGRHSLRLGPIVGRKQQMIKLKGTTLYPPALFEVLQALDFVDEYVAEASKDNYGMDSLKVYYHDATFLGEKSEQLLAVLKEKLRVSPEVLHLSMSEILKMQFPEGARKIIRWRDLRI